MTATTSPATLPACLPPTKGQSWSLGVVSGWAPWIEVGLTTNLENGVYEIEGDDWHYDCELAPGQIEIYDHPERGQSYWDDLGDDGTDFAGHISTGYLHGSRIRRVLPNDGSEPRSLEKSTPPRADSK